MLKDFKKISVSMTTIGSTLSAIFTGVGILLDFIFLFVPNGPSAMHLEMRESFKQFNRKLDDIKDQITDLSNHIDWKFKESKFDEYANEIDTLVEKIDQLSDYENGAPAFESKKEDVIRYCNVVHSHEFVNFLIDMNFFETYAATTKNDRRKVLDLMKVVLYYVTQAIKTDAACLHLKGEPQGRIDQESKDWQKEIHEFQQVMTQAGDQVKNAGHGQAKYTDIPRYLRNYHYQSNQHFSAGLRDFLMNKYYWRDWIVISYKDIGTYDKHCVTDSHYTWHWFRTHGRNLVVSSVPEHKSISRDTSTSGWCKYWLPVDRARWMWRSITNRATAKVVIESNNDIWISTDNRNRYFLKTYYECSGRHFVIVLFF